MFFMLEVTQRGWPDGESDPSGTGARAASRPLPSRHLRLHMCQSRDVSWLLPIERGGTLATAGFAGLQVSPHSSQAAGSITSPGLQQSLLNSPQLCLHFPAPFLPQNGLARPQPSHCILPLLVPGSKADPPWCDGLPNPESGLLRHDGGIWAGSAPPGAPCAWDWLDSGLQPTGALPIGR